MLKVKKLNPNAIVPTRGTKYSAGLDLYAEINESVTVNPSEIVKIPTGIAVELPQNTAGFIFARSSLGTKHGISPANAVGVIDSDYRGELIVSLINNFTQSYTINPHDRIAQLVIINVEFPQIVLCDELEETQRGNGGFGSTGK